MKKISVGQLCRAGLIAAAYFAISLVLLPFAFGAVQVRAAEALTLLPVLSSTGIWGVTIGCLLTNVYGAATGANILGAADIVFGTAATLAAAVLTRLFRNVRFGGLPLISALFPVVINAFVVGAELTFVMTNQVFHPLFWVNFAQVALGQAVSCLIFGVVLVKAFEKGNIKV